MKNRKIHFIKLTLLFFGVIGVFQNCQNDEENVPQFPHENTQKLNLKTVSFRDAQNFFDVEIERQKRKHYASKNNSSFLELTPDWNTIRHNNMYGIDEAQLTLADIKVNREGDYESKLFFININGKTESIIYTIYLEEIATNGKIISAKMYFNKLNGEFFDGYKIVNGKITKRFVIKEGVNIQNAGFLIFFQSKEDCWNTDYLPEDGVLEEIDLGTVNGDENQGGGGTPVTLNISSINWYYLGNGNSTGPIYSSGGGGSITSGAGTLYANSVKELAEGEEQIINNLTDKALCVYNKLENNNLIKNALDKFKAEDAPVHLIIKQEDIEEEDVAGMTEYGDIITITLDTPYMENSPSLLGAYTILHEAIHAKIYRMIRTRSLLQYNQYTNTYHLPDGSRAHFPTLFDYYNDYPNNPQHNYMADYYRTAMEEGLKEYAQLIGKTYPAQLYKDIAWAGLHNTKAWNNMYSDPLYTQNEQKRILNSIKNFKNSGTNECN